MKLQITPVTAVLNVGTDRQQVVLLGHMYAGKYGSWFVQTKVVPYGACANMGQHALWLTREILEEEGPK